MPGTSIRFILGLVDNKTGIMSI